MSDIKVTAKVLSVDVQTRLDNLLTIDWNKRLGECGALVEAAAKENLLSTGVNKTGELLRSISYRVLDNTAEVYTNVPYATYVEFGTGSFAENGDGRKGYWVYVDEECGAPKSIHRNIYTLPEAQRVWHILAEKYGPEHVHITNGQVPTRFLRNALDKNEDKIKAILSKEIREVK